MIATPGWNWRFSPSWPEVFARLPLFSRIVGVAMQPAAITTTFASTRKRWDAAPVKGATTRPSTPLARRPSVTTRSTRTEVSTLAPLRIAAGT